MAPPGGRGGRGRGRGRGGGRERGRGGGGGGGGGKVSVDRGSQGRKGRSSRPESDPDNEHLYTNVDQFHMQKDKIDFGGGGSDSDDSDESEQEEGVMDLQGVGGDSHDDDSDGDNSSEEDDDSDASDLPELPEHVRRAAMEASSDEGDSDEEGEGAGKFAAGWGKNRSSYYNADTADLEIGQEFEDAEAEEEAALELQRASYKGLDAADYGEEEEEEEEEEEGEGDKGAKGGRSRKGKEKRKSKVAGSGTAHGAALSAMKSDLEQIALGGAGEVETSVVKRDTSKLSRRDKLELVLSEAPELPALLGEVRVQLETLTGSVQPLVSNVTADLGASKDGLVYLRTRQQLLLASCLNTCFYMILKAKGEPAKDHPVVRRLLSLRALLGDMATLDDKMSSQVELLLRALASGVDLAGAGAGDSGDEEGASDDAAEGDAKGRRGGGGVDAMEDSAGSSAEEGGGGDVDEEDLEDEEARFMGDASGGGGGGGSGSEDGDKPELSAAAARKKARRESKKTALAKAKAKAMMAGGTGGLSSLGDFGDEDVDERSGTATAGRGGGGGENLLQGMVNRISQRDTAITGKRGSRLQGDADVPIRERDQTIRVRRPAPGESDEEGEEGAGGEGGDGDSGAESDDFLGGGDFMGGLPPGLLEGLSGRGGAAAGGEKKVRSKKGGASKRERGEGGGAGGEGEGEEDAFYAAVAEDKERKKRAKQEKYQPKSRIAGALEAELEAERAARGETKRGASYTIIKNRGLTPHKNKLNRNPRTKKREAFRKATIRRKGQVRDIRTGEADTYGGESTGIKSNVTRSRKLKG